MRPQDIDAIVVHCTASRPGIDLHVIDIDRDHRINRGFKMIGYNYVICLDGTIETGRPLTMDGAHCPNCGSSGRPYNKHSIGICYVGGLDKNGKPANTLTPAQARSLVKLVYDLINKYPNIKEVIGHRDTYPDKNGDGKIDKRDWLKACPCFDVRSMFPMSYCTAKK